MNSIQVQDIKRRISFNQEDVSFQLKDKRLLRSWILECVALEKKEIESITFVFCSDDYLLEMNKRFLNHDTYTDIITFDNAQAKWLLDGDIFISYDRVKENASEFGVNLRDELHRVMIHGVLHLCGYKDKTKAHKTQMTAKEDNCLNLRRF